MSSEAVNNRILTRDDIYKGRLLEKGTPRRGDLAVIVKSHCTPESGLVVRVVEDPHRAAFLCAECGIETVEWAVEVEATKEEPWPQDLAKLGPGPYFIPLSWLRRVLPLTPASKRLAKATAEALR